jgi:hypothetical protein
MEMGIGIWSPDIIQHLQDWREAMQRQTMAS